MHNCVTTRKKQRETMRKKLRVTMRKKSMSNFCTHNYAQLCVKKPHNFFV